MGEACRPGALDGEGVLAMVLCGFRPGALTLWAPDNPSGSCCRGLKNYVQ